jgi:hypothetical protein
MEKEAPQISRFFGGKKVDFYHNPTSMVHESDVAGYYKDLTQAGTQKLGRVTQEVNGLVQHLRKHVKAVGKSGRVIHIAHSQGALVTYLASKQLSPIEMKQIEVLAFGGAAALRSSAETPFHRCVNYYSVNDPLLFVVPSAEQALRSGLIVDKEFCFLAPRVGDPIEDHHLLGPTYASALAYEGSRFQRHYQSLMYRVLKTIVLAFIAIINASIRKWFVQYMNMRQYLLKPLIQKLYRRMEAFFVMALHMLWGLMTRKRGQEGLDLLFG